jgi:hypothetical protein
MRGHVETSVSRLAAALFAFLAFAASARADVSASSPFQGGEIAHDASTEVPIRVVVGCDLALFQGGGTVEVTFQQLPAWLSSELQSVEVDPAGCVPGVTGNITQDVPMQITPASNAPGLLPFVLNATVTFTGEVMEPTGQVSQPATVTVLTPETKLAYRPGHTMTPDGDQTFQVPANEPYTFDLRLDIHANARTMIMFEDKTLSNPDALLNGLRAETYDVAAGQTSETRKVMFTPPGTPWESVVVTFRTYSHCLDGENCGNQLERTVTWTFTNAGGAEPSAQDPESGSKDTPGPAFLVVLFALLAAFVARRR